MTTQRLLIALIVVGLASSVTAPPAHAQVATDQQTTPQGRPPVRPRVVPRDVLRAYFHVEGTEMTAINTFDAVLGRTRIFGRGGGAEALNLWNGLFARVAFSAARETGDRVIVTENNEVLPVGIPVTVQLQPIEIGGGWRARPVASGRLVGYLGGGVLLMRYRETSDFGGDEDNTDTTYRGYLGFAGVEAALGGWIIAGAEAQYRLVPDAIGSGGVSKAFGETDLGGVTVRVLVGVRR